MASVTSEKISPTRSVKRSKLHVAVVEYLLQDLQEGVYKEGDELPSERKLMEDFGVGRPSIRESLATLERMGLISTHPGAKAKVCRPTMEPLLGEMRETMQLYVRSGKRMRELQEFRMFFETMLVRELAKRITSEQLASLSSVLEAQASVLQDRKKFAELDIRFHHCLSDALNNSLLGTFADSVADWLLDQRMQTLKTPGRADEALKEHRAIFEALAKGDPDAAEQSMREHLNNVCHLYSLSEADRPV